MRKLSYIFLTALTALQVSSCSDSEIDAWQSRYVWFTDTLVNFSNMQQPNVAEGGTLVAAIPLTMAADVSDKDRVVNVEVVGQPNDSRTKYEVQNPVKIRAGRFVDTMYVNVINSNHLDQVYDSITFRILPSADFQPGLLAYQKTTLCLHNGYEQPAWWDFDATFTLGYFTQLKMKIFILVTGGTDDPRTMEYWSDADLALKYTVFLLNDYVEQNNIRYPDDDPDAPGQKPVFDFWSY